MTIFDNVLVGTSCTWEVGELRKLVGALVGDKSSKTNWETQEKPGVRSMARIGWWVLNLRLLGQQGEGAWWDSRGTAKGEWGNPWSFRVVMMEPDAPTSKARTKSGWQDLCSRWTLNRMVFELYLADPEGGRKKTVQEWYDKKICIYVCIHAWRN